MAHEFSFYVYRSSEDFEPVIIEVRDDGSARELKTTCPSGSFGSIHLHAVGQITDQVCFKDTLNQEIYIWQVSAERIMEIIRHAEDGLGGAYGFARMADGNVKIIRWLRPNLRQINAVGSHLYYEMLHLYRGGAWIVQKEERIDPFIADKKNSGKLVGHNLFWVGRRSGTVIVMRYDVETDQKEDLALPLLDVAGDPTILDTFTLGHGLDGELAACLFIRSTSVLRNWSLREGNWVLTRTVNVSGSLDRRFIPFVPLIYYLGRDDGLLKLVFLKQGKEMVILSHSEDEVLSREFTESPPLISSTVGSRRYLYDKGAPSHCGGRLTLDEQESPAKRQRRNFIDHDDLPYDD